MDHNKRIESASRLYRPLYRKLASTIQAYKNCIASGNEEWRDKHADQIQELEKMLPSGSGIDSGCKIDVDQSTPHKLVITTSFHHMNDVGMYDGWTDHKVTVTPSFDGIDIHISGRNRNQIKDYLHDVFDVALREGVKCM